MSANFLSSRKSGRDTPAPFARNLLPPFFPPFALLAYFIPSLEVSKEAGKPKQFQKHPGAIQHASENIIACFHLTNFEKLALSRHQLGFFPSRVEGRYLGGSGSNPKVSANPCEMAGWDGTWRGTMLLLPSL